MTKVTKLALPKSYTLHAAVISVPELEAGLHVVATPIGNLEDITLRALRILASADRIACEDTRVTAKLLQRYGIKNKLLAYHEHNAREQGVKLLDLMNSGEAIALVSDAGTPLLSDPGALLVREAQKQNIPITAYPGASALLTALVSSGLPVDEFHFAGFLPPKTNARRKALETLIHIPGTLIFYETAPRLSASLNDMNDILGDREAAMCRELTKLHETIVRESLSALAKRFSTTSVKGEIVIVVAPATKTGEKVDFEPLLKQALEKFSLKEAVAKIAAETKLPRRDIYARALQLKDKT